MAALATANPPSLPDRSAVHVPAPSAPPVGPIELVERLRAVMGAGKDFRWQNRHPAQVASTPGAVAN
jgi:hypothetical protein